MKKFTILCLVLSLSLMTGCGCDKKPKDNDSKKEPSTEEKENNLETGTGVFPDKEVQGVKFTNASISYVDDMSTIVATVKNTTDNEITLDVFTILVKDRSGNVLVEIPGFVAEKLQPGEEKPLTAYITMDLTKATDIEYKF